MLTNFTFFGQIANPKGPNF